MRDFPAESHICQCVHVDKSTHVTLGGFLIGAVVGFGGGVLYSMARRAWNDVTGARKTADAANQIAWRRTGELILLGFFLAVIAALALGGLADR